MKRITKQTKKNLFAKCSYSYFSADEEDKFLAHNSSIMEEYTTDQLLRLYDCDKPLVEKFEDLHSSEKLNYTFVKENLNVSDRDYYRRVSDRYMYEFRKVLKSVIENRTDYKRAEKLDYLLS